MARGFASFRRFRWRLCHWLKDRFLRGPVFGTLLGMNPLFMLWTATLSFGASLATLGSALATLGASLTALGASFAATLGAALSSLLYIIFATTLTLTHVLNST